MDNCCLIGKINKLSIEPSLPLLNKGTGAGGATTNLNGKKFENYTDNEQRLLQSGYIKHFFKGKEKEVHGYYLIKKFEDKTITFVLQHGLKLYMKNKYNIKLFRKPDEAYIIEYNNGKKVLKILEKKVQNRDGSVDTKLWSAHMLKIEYEYMLHKENFQVEYAFCVNNYLKEKLHTENKCDKYWVLYNILLPEINVPVLFADLDNYFEILDTWINQE